MTLAQHVRTLGRGPGRSRSLTLPEAEDAMTTILAGNAAPEALGALLMLLRMKGETAEEIAGFVRAAQTSVAGLPQVDLDWPSYAAGRTRGLAWFLLSAQLVARAGYRVLIHGWNGPDAAVRQGVEAFGIPFAAQPADVEALLDRHGIAYLPLETLSPAVFKLLNLRDTFGLRSCVNTVCRMLNPAKASASVQGVFHPSYRLLQADAAQLLGWQALSVIKGGGGEFERNPAKPIAGFGLRGGAPWEETTSVLIDETRRMDDGERDAAQLRALWDGTRTDDFAEAVVIGTAALALDTLGADAPEDLARALWRDRKQPLAA
ncbi:glycosyl transferase family protein [Tropicibacter naphthalenivorans]|uniref:Anthranilate synthase component II n=1 Tax=Tropicibacter naphthalenivorans TaxID=441103 RepID=A0A0P1G1M0_9RHOB|nr:glycosyl transferase family protein [Tropicibacter naphthalenivorans]CUH75614.1 Anthranilate synthase component II [Tropicibacter naphthalenivorans]SMC43202.1 Anthranilate phosphoribosyltransferase [Tropicibacter naphthalenivorans]